MPELPEVETVRRGLIEALGGVDSGLSGAKLAEWHFVRQDLRYPLEIPKLQGLVGSQLTAIERRSKYLLLYLGSWPCGPSGPSCPCCRLVLHLGMTGVLRVCAQRPELRKHDHLWLRLDLATGRSLYLLYNDVRRFGSLELDTEIGDRFAALGIEPFRAGQYRAPFTLRTELPALSGDFLYRASRRVRRALKPWLLEGKVVCGVGNIYCSEALWRAALAPGRSAMSLKKAEAERLAETVLELIEQAIEAGGTTLKDFRSTEGRPGYFQRQLYAYGRSGEPCLRQGCKGHIERLVQAQRATFFCGVCQN